MRKLFTYDGLSITLLLEVLYIHVLECNYDKISSRVGVVLYELG